MMRLSIGVLVLMFGYVLGCVCGNSGAYAQPAPDLPYTFAGFVEPDFPFITTTLDAGHLGPGFPEKNLAVRCLAVQLGAEAYACFDTDLLRMALLWEGDFMELLTMAQVSYHAAGNKRNGIPRITGRPLMGTGIYPGWTVGEPTFEDPRPAGPNPDEVGRGPLPASFGRWDGLYLHDDRVVLHYTVGDVTVYEMPGSVVEGRQRGIVRTFRVGASTEPLTLVVGEMPGAVGGGDEVVVPHATVPDSVRLVRVVGLPSAELRASEEGSITLQVPPGKDDRAFSVLFWQGPEAGLSSARTLLGASPALPAFEDGGPARWAEPVTTRGERAPDEAAYVVDRLPLPLDNPWQRNVRVSAVDFFSDGRAAVSTFEGDVWIVSGISDDLAALSWKRFASGLYEPMSLCVVDDEVYTFGRMQITRFRDLNGDGEADRYENFSNLAIQTGESREYPLGMVERPGGGFYLAKGSALDNGPQTSPRVRPGFRLGSQHSGTILEVAPDGRSIEVYASGFREPHIGIIPETGQVTASDQQGNFVPSTPILLVEEGGYYGVPVTAHLPEPLPPESPPLTWTPHRIDRSGAGQVWVDSDRMGPLNRTLMHLSYGAPGAYRIFIDDAVDPPQGGIVPLPFPFTSPTMRGQVNPVDGRLYLAGFQVWDSNAREISALVRLRYTGLQATFPVGYRAGREGVWLRFATPLDPEALADSWRVIVSRWNYKRTEEYGSAHYKLDGETGQELLPVERILLSESGTDVFLEIPDMRTAMQLAVEYNFISAAGDSIESGVYGTLHSLVPLDLPLDTYREVYTAPEGGPVATVESDAEAGATAEQGRVLYERLGCFGCHSDDGSTEGRTGPSFKGLYGSARRFNDGSETIADDAYLRDSILHPANRIVEGYVEGMPIYEGVLLDQQVESIVTFIRSLSEDGQ